MSNLEGSELMELRMAMITRVLRLRRRRRHRQEKEAGHKRRKHPVIFSQSQTQLLRLPSFRLTVMVHPADASVAYPTMVAHGGLEGLALAAHGVGGGVPPLGLHGHGAAGDRSRVAEGRLGVAGKSEGNEGAVPHSEDGIYPLRDGEEGDGRGGVQHEEPYEGGHDGPCLVAGVHPSPIVLPRPEGAAPGLPVKRVEVGFPLDPYPGHGLLRSPLRLVVRVVVFEPLIDGVVVGAAAGLAERRRPRPQPRRLVGEPVGLMLGARHGTGLCLPVPSGLPAENKHQHFRRARGGGGGRYDYVSPDGYSMDRYSQYAISVPDPT